MIDRARAGSRWWLRLHERRPPVSMALWPSTSAGLAMPAWTWSGACLSALFRPRQLPWQAKLTIPVWYRHSCSARFSRTACGARVAERFRGPARLLCST